MGGRGSAGGISDKGIKYGEEYHTVLASENIKFVKKHTKSATAPMETMSPLKNRVNVLVNNINQLKAITFYDDSGKRTKEIHFDDHQGLLPHAHIGYDYSVDKLRMAIKLNSAEKKIFNKVKKLWEGYENE
jgi:hypothetical protein